MKNILFLCTGNSCRSQMAEGWLRYLHSEKFTAFSAGIERHGLNPNAVKVMAEAGVDISQQQSQTVQDLGETPLDVVFTVCGHADENCPVFLGAPKILHMGFEDPPKMAKALAEQGEDEEKQLDCYRQVRDKIKSFILNIESYLN